MKIITFKNGSTITFRNYPAGKESFQGVKDHIVLIEDGPGFYRWWQMPLYWWRVAVNFAFMVVSK